jgi:hypothetical protein
MCICDVYVPVLCFACSVVVYMLKRPPEKQVEQLQLRVQTLAEPRERYQTRRAAVLD